MFSFSIQFMPNMFGTIIFNTVYFLLSNSGENELFCLPCERLCIQNKCLFKQAAIFGVC